MSRKKYRKRLTTGATYHWDDLNNLFNGISQGGIYPPSDESFAVVFSRPESIYRDSADGTAVEYIGSGREGDQSPTQYRNKRLVEIEDGTLSGPVYYFYQPESENIWFYVGEFDVISWRYEYDHKENRRVIVFELYLTYPFTRK